jgi:NTE family protein
VNWPEAGRPRRVAVVVAGAGARGGYEAGALSVLLPRLHSAGIETSVYVGTSAGAINATIFAALAHLPADEQAQQALAVWNKITVADVFASPVLGSPAVAARFAGQLLRVPGVQLTNLVSTAPLHRYAKTAVDWDQLHTNIGRQNLTLAVVATSGTDNRTVVFVERSSGRVPPPDDSRPIDYVAATVGPDHVLASAAIPIVFPPVHVAEPSARSGWYLDGGIRLNAPLKPALALGADAVVVVATHPEKDCSTPVRGGPPPDIDDVIVRLLDAALVDRMVEDLHSLAMINTLVDHADTTTSSGRPLRLIPFLAVGPAERGTLAALAEEVFEQHRRRSRGLVPALRAAELHLLGRILAGDGPRRGDLYSYLYFDPEFIEASIELGRSDAQALFAGVSSGQVPWRTGPDTLLGCKGGVSHSRV